MANSAQSECSRNFILIDSFDRQYDSRYRNAGYCKRLVKMITSHKLKAVCRFKCRTRAWRIVHSDRGLCVSIRSLSTIEMCHIIGKPEHLVFQLRHGYFTPVSRRIRLGHCDQVFWCLCLISHCSRRSCTISSFGHSISYSIALQGSPRPRQDGSCLDQQDNVDHCRSYCHHPRHIL